jgi:deoxyribodipyrimidine photo-lyase
MTPLPDLRIRGFANTGRSAGRFVLYWMVGARRLTWNPALDHAVALAHRLNRGLLIFEPLRIDYPWASARFHTFVLQGMVDNAAAAAGVPGVRYLPYVEPSHGASRDLLEALAAEAAVVVTDDVPGFFQARMVDRVAPRLPCPVEVVDGWGVAPMRAPGQAFPTAFAFRRFLQAQLAGFLPYRPAADPFATPLTAAAPDVPLTVAARWPAFDVRQDVAGFVRRLAIDQAVGAVDDVPGGSRAAAARLARFITHGLPRYVDDRNDPDAAVTSGLSPYLHFGHLSAHELFHAVMRREGWLGEVPRGGRGARAGWWGVSPEAEGFLDQLVTWRELGANTCTYLPAYDTYGSLPSWARATLEKHADDVRDPSYTLAELDAATTYDTIWNAAQRELRQDGQLHNYLRMLWGKKILQWTRSPEEALAVMIELNNKYALDGRDPNSYSGIFWTLGRYDRPWGPERAIFGTIRYMSSDNTARKVKLKGYLERYAPQRGLF